MKIVEKIEKKGGPFYSLEFFPPKEKEQWPDFFEVVGKLKAMDPLFASVTCGAGGSGQNHTMEIAGLLKRDYGLEPMTHFTCVGATTERIEEFLTQLDENGIDNVLALRGDKPKNAASDWQPGEYGHAEDLVRYIRARRPGISIGVAAYPAPHPESPTFASDRAFLASKIRCGANFVVTQLFFDSREYIALVGELRRAGVDCPVIPGILPIQSLSSIKHTISLCGANIPGKLFMELEKAHEEGGTEAVKEVGLRYAIDQIRRLLDAGAPGIHLYTLNRAELCLKIMREVGSL